MTLEDFPIGEAIIIHGVANNIRYERISETHWRRKLDKGGTREITHGAMRRLLDEYPWTMPPRFPGD